MPGGVIGGPLVEHDMCIGVVNRHERFIDNITGQPLNPELCRIALRKDIDDFRSKGVWDKRRVQEAWSRTGRPPISVSWVEVNKGDDEHPNYRSRLVAREMRMAGADRIFAPTPPLESLQMVLSYAVTDFPDEPRKVRGSKYLHRCQVLSIDISRAYFNEVAREDEPMYVELPPEVGVAAGSCALLKRHMYGRQRAADGWQSESSGTLCGLGFAQSAASACVYRHKERQFVSSVHGDDWTVSGPCSSSIVSKLL